MHLLAAIALLLPTPVVPDDLEMLKKEVQELRSLVQDEKVARLELEVQVRDLLLEVRQLQDEIAELRRGAGQDRERPQAKREPRPEPPEVEPRGEKTERSRPSADDRRRADEAWQRARSLSQLEDYGGMLDALNEAIEILPDAPPLLYNRGWTLVRLDRHAKALEDFNRVIELGETGWEVYFHRGLAYHGLERYDDAIKDYQRTLKIDPRSAGNNVSYYNIACAYSLQGKKTEAIRYLQRAVEKGFDQFKHMEEDSDLESLHGDPRFEEIVGRGREL